MALRLSLPRPPAAVVTPVYDRLRGWIVTTLSPSRDFGVDYHNPLDDPGLFGPGSVTWKIHSDFPGMMSGGIAALMLQTLHPRAMAGVWDHSRFRFDPLERLRNTTMFVAATSYAATADAERIIAMVDRMHAKVAGHTPAGEPYSARDPELLTWVHCTEMAMFLQGYMRYRRAELDVAIQDRYFNETRLIAEKLGAENVPSSKAEMDAYFRQVQPQLRFDERSRETLAVLETLNLPIPVSGVSRRMFLGAGAALLPAWAQRHLRRGPRQRLLDRASAEGLNRIGPLIRAATRDGVSMAAARRCGQDRACLSFD